MATDVEASKKPPGVDERYQAATSTSNLRIEADRAGAGDVILSAGGIQQNVRELPSGEKILVDAPSPVRLGMSLLRLHSEWDSAAKPKRATEAQIEATAERMRREDEQSRLRHGPPNPKAPRPVHVLLRARAEARAWYAAELRLLAQSLKSRAAATEQLILWGAQKGVGAATVTEALYYWLDHICPVCDGHGLRKVPGQPFLSARQCHVCHGSGETVRPDGSTQVLNHIDYSLGLARSSLQRRLRKS